MKLLLFDIDGTILLTHGIGRRAVEASLSELSGRRIDTTGISFSGKTDPQIIREVLMASGFHGTSLNGLMEEALEAYTELMRESIRPESTELLGGVKELIEELSQRDDVQLSLLTGNLEPLAYLKLNAVGLDHYFPFGAFGSDHEDRYQLPPIAMARAREHTGRAFDGSNVVIIGDTEHDIGCGRGVGAFSVAVCTGRFDRDYLHQHEPDVLLECLDDPDEFISAVFSN